MKWYPNDIQNDIQMICFDIFWYIVDIYHDTPKCFWYFSLSTRSHCYQRLDLLTAEHANASGAAAGIRAGSEFEQPANLKELIEGAKRFEVLFLLTCRTMLAGQRWEGPPATHAAMPGQQRELSQKIDVPFINFIFERFDSKSVICSALGIVTLWGLRRFEDWSALGIDTSWKSARCANLQVTILWCWRVVACSR